MKRWTWTASAFLLAVGAQALDAHASASRIWYEELAESVRNVYWLADRRIYDGISSNVGWYGLLLVVYRAIGFSLNTAKYVRVAVAAIAIACVLDLLARAMGTRRAIVPALAFALSPALLYFNTMQASYGIDAQVAPIALWLVATAPLDGSRRGRVMIFAAGLIVGIGALMWPVMMLYVPALAVYLVGRASESKRVVPFGAWLLAAAGAALPLGCALLYVRTPATLVNDPVLHSGVFRGGGGRPDLSPSHVVLMARLMIHELFTGGRSYCADLAHADFSGPLGFVGFAAVVALVPRAWRAGGIHRVAIAAALVLLAVNVAAALTASGVPGLRRETGIVVAVYVLFAVEWAVATPWAALVLSVLLLHHAAVFVPNWIALHDRSPMAAVTFFSTDPTPAASLDRWRRDVEHGAALDCRSVGESECRYQEMYAAITGWSEWNGGPPVVVRAFDPDSGRIVGLTRESWPAGSPRH